MLTGSTQDTHVYLLDSTLIHSLLTNELNLEWPFQGVVGRGILNL